MFYDFFMPSLPLFTPLLLHCVLRGNHIFPVMKKIEIVVGPEKVRDVCEALHDMGIHGIVLNESRFIDNAIEDDSKHLENEIVIPPKISLVLTIPNSLVEPAIFTIVSAARNGIQVDGKIIVSSVEKIIQLDDEEIDEHVLRWYQLTS
jgi:nitrogen regulatory protein P-II 1